MEKFIKEKKVCVIGLGYIGLPLATLLSKTGYKVSGVDINIEVINSINEGKAHIVEPKLQEELEAAILSKNLIAYKDPPQSDIYIICVPTPFFEDSGVKKPNTEFIFNALEGISGQLKAGDLLILESTSPVGTTRQLAKILDELGIDVSLINIAFCPERVIPGSIMNELIQNDRIVGGLTKEATTLTSKFYNTFVQGSVIETDAETAEMCKLTENSFRDVNIAFANELSLLCDENKIDVDELINLANRHPRVNILKSGVGVGGHCIAVDPWFIVAQDPANSRMISLAREINDNKPEWVVQKIKDFLKEEFQGVQNSNIKITCLGASYKPDIDDLRGSPALEIIKSLQEDKFTAKVVEPNLISHEGINLIELADVFEDTDLIVVLVGHKEFLESNFLDKLSKTTYLDFCGLVP